MEKQRFSGIPPRTIHTFKNLMTIFASQFATNRAKRLKVADLFDINQAKEESLKKYLIVGAENPVLMSAAEQIFSAGEKRMRPALVFLVSRATAELLGLK
ncbi:Solanesyl diphosphate synthase 2, chloroplastic, partial [Mucuna pruriens]